MQRDFLDRDIADSLIQIATVFDTVAYITLPHRDIQIGREGVAGTYRLASRNATFRRPEVFGIEADDPNPCCGWFVFRHS